MSICSHAGLHPRIAVGIYIDPVSVIIGDDVTIGHKAMLHGCTIGNRILIGNPARRVSPLTDKELKCFHYTTKRCADLAAEYLA